MCNCGRGSGVRVVLHGPRSESDDFETRILACIGNQKQSVFDVDRVSVSSAETISKSHVYLAQKGTCADCEEVREGTACTRGRILLEEPNLTCSQLHDSRKYTWGHDFGEDRPPM